KALTDLQQIAEQDLPLPLEMTFAVAQQLNELAWHYVAGPETERAPNKALPLIHKAIKLTPENWVFFNTQGVAYYRLGQYPKAVEWLERSVQDSKGEATAFDLFFLAMCHAKLGAPDKARDCYDRAVRWVREHPLNDQPTWPEELRAFQAEAEAVLAIPRK